MGVIQLIKDLHNRYLENKCKERRVLRGDVIGVSRILYDHYGIYLGNDQVIQYTLSQDRIKLEIRKTNFAQFLHRSSTFFILDCEFEKPLKSDPIKYRGGLFRLPVFSREETVRRAESRLGEVEYNLLSNNCEHFAIWCKTGISISYQVEEYLKYIPRIKFSAERFSEAITD